MAAEGEDEAFWHREARHLREELVRAHHHHLRQEERIAQQEATIEDLRRSQSEMYERWREQSAKIERLEEELRRLRDIRGEG